MQARLTVGELARLAGLSKQTLIFYDREGVFRPSQVDPQNGYRYYTADQLETLDTILNLREMGVPLREIRAHMASRSAAETMMLLREQKLAAESKIARWDLVRRRLERKMESLKALENPGRWLVDLPALPVALEPVGGRRDLLEADMALKRLLRRAAENHLPHFYQLGDTVAAEDLAAGCFLRFSEAFLPLLEPRLGESMRPAGRYAQRFHRGTYETMGEDYEALLEQIAQAGLRPAGGSWEFCILDSLASDTPEAYVTEIQIPVEPADGPAERTEQP